MTSRIALALEKLRSNGLTAKEYGTLGKQWQALLDVVEAVMLGPPRSEINELHIAGTLDALAARVLGEEEQG